MQVEIKLLMGLKTDFQDILFYYTSFIHQYKAASYWCFKHTVKKERGVYEKISSYNVMLSKVVTRSVGTVSNRISDGFYSGSLCRLPSSLANSAETKSTLVSFSWAAWLLFFQTCQKYFRNPCSFLLTHLYTCLFLSATDYGCSNQLDLISFPPQMFRFRSFPSLWTFVVSFPSAGVLVFCFCLFVCFLFQP